MANLNNEKKKEYIFSEMKQGMEKKGILYSCPSQQLAETSLHGVAYTRGAAMTTQNVNAGRG